jgi:Leucine-rich repeat (LRR) protein
LTNLTFLALGGTQVSDAGLEHLARLTSLTTLDLRDTKVSDAGLKDLLKLQGLVTLGVENTRISASGFATLKAALPGENAVRWSEPNRSAAEAALMLGGVVEVLPDGKAATLAVKAAADLPPGYFRLTRVSLAGVARDPSGALTRLEALTDPKFDRFQSLVLDGVPVGNPLLAQLAKLPLLTELSLARCGLTDEALGNLIRFRKLRRLVLDGNPLRTPDLGLLKALPELTDLSLAGCPMLDDLRLGGLAGSGLERLSLAGSSVTDESIMGLHGLKELRDLDLRGTRATAEGAAVLRKVLPRCEVLTGPLPK